MFSLPPLAPGKGLPAVKTVPRPASSGKAEGGRKAFPSPPPGGRSDRSGPRRLYPAAARQKTGHLRPQVRRYISTEAATAAFKDSQVFCMGRLTVRPQAARKNSETPWLSEPMTRQ